MVRLSRGDYDIVQNFGEEAAANSSGFFVHREPVQLVGCAGVDAGPARTASRESLTSLARARVGDAGAVPADARRL